MIKKNIVDKEKYTKMIQWKFMDLFLMNHAWWKDIKITDLNNIGMHML